jgi:ABC-2 type transport system permease protein
MREVLILLHPRLWTFKNGPVSGRAQGRKLRFFIFWPLGLGIWAGAFLIIYRVLVYFRGVEDVGTLLAYKLLSMALVLFFSLLVFSGILISLSKLYLSKDLPLVHAMPVPCEKIFLARWMEATLDSSWMVLIYNLPVFISYGIVFKAGASYYAMLVIHLIPFCLIASILGAIFVMLAAVVLPAGHIRSIFFFLSLFLFVSLILSFRMVRPERFVRPESFASLMLYLKTLESPLPPWLPTTWIYDSLRDALSGSVRGALFDGALAWSGALTLIFVASGASGHLYFIGWSRAQTASRRVFPSLGLRHLENNRFLRVLPGPLKAFSVKEIKTFFRDQTQWSQIFLLVALIVIYLYNVSVLPLSRSALPVVYLQNFLSFLNMGLVAFVLAAVSARFVFPAVSMEGEAFWIVKSSPVTLRAFLWMKFLVYFLPLLFLSELLTVATNLILDVSPFMMFLSVTTIFFMLPGIVSMALGLGAIYPDFHSENPAQSVTSFGGLIYMTVSMAFIAAVIVLEAGPVYRVLMMSLRRGHLHGHPMLGLSVSLATVVILCLLALVMPMRLGERAISRSELSRPSQGKNQKTVSGKQKVIGRKQ